MKILNILRYSFVSLFFIFVGLFVVVFYSILGTALFGAGEMFFSLGTILGAVIGFMAGGYQLLLIGLMPILNMAVSLFRRISLLVTLQF